MNYLLLEFGIREAIDLGLVIVLFYWLLLWIRRARAGLAMLGICVLGLAYLLVRYLELTLTASIFQGFFAIFVIVLVVIFQNDLRQLLERIAVWVLRRPSGSPLSAERNEALVTALGELARRRHGALVVLPGRDPLTRHLEGGVALDGRLSYPLLVSLFDPGSLGHDGAAIVEGDRVSRFSVHLPLSRDFEKLGHLGTRHSAALGLAERTDALAVVVSEERGKISVARHGALRPLDGSKELLRTLDDFARAEKTDRKRRSGSTPALRRNWKEKLAAAGLGMAAWLLFAAGSQGLQRSYTLPVMVDNIPPGFAVRAVRPKEVEVSLSGPRRKFYLLDKAALEVRLDADLVALGRATFRLNENDVRHPTELTVVGIRPRQVELVVGRINEAESGR